MELLLSPVLLRMLSDVVGAGSFIGTGYWTPPTPQISCTCKSNFGALKFELSAEVLILQLP
jgi:hypothetical protein